MQVATWPIGGFVLKCTRYSHGVYGPGSIRCWAHGKRSANGELEIAKNQMYVNTRNRWRSLLAIFSDSSRNCSRGRCTHLRAGFPLHIVRLPLLESVVALEYKAVLTALFESSCINCGTVAVDVGGYRCSCHNGDLKKATDLIWTSGYSDSQDSVLSSVGKGVLIIIV